MFSLKRSSTIEMISLARAWPGSSLSLRILKIAVYKSEKIVKTLKFFFLFSLTAILKTSRGLKSSVLKISLEWSKARHFSFYLVVFQAIPTLEAPESSLELSN
jgi:hypothetical protein